MGSLIGYAGNVVLVKNLRKMIHKEGDSQKKYPHESIMRIKY
jgi:hypothetical protein